MLHLRAPRLLAVIVGLAAGGCIFTDKINEAPKVSLEPEGSPPYYIGDKIWLTAEGSRDPDGHELTFSWTLEHDSTPVDPAFSLDCGEFVAPGRFCFIPYARINYTVTLRVTDKKGAPGPAEVRNFLINNRPPVADLASFTIPKENGAYTIGREIWLHAGGSDDPDEGDRLTYTWSYDDPPAAPTPEFVFTESDAARNPTTDPAEAVGARLVPDREGVYVLTVAVSDGDATDLASLQIFVDPDQPPCIVSTDPDFMIPLLIWSTTEINDLEVLAVEDDLDPYPAGQLGGASFRWQIEDTPGAGYFEPGGFNSPVYNLNGADFSLGQIIRVRVIAEDRQSLDLSGCPPDQLRCAVQAGCFQWVTWEIEFL